MASTTNTPRPGLVTRRPGTYPYEHGREAARGERPSGNPYSAGTDPHHIWQRGYDDESGPVIAEANRRMREGGR
jgi:hypothetical protein